MDAAQPAQPAGSEPPAVPLQAGAAPSGEADVLQDEALARALQDQFRMEDESIRREDAQARQGPARAGPPAAPRNAGRAGLKNALLAALDTAVGSRNRALQTNSPESAAVATSTAIPEPAQEGQLQSPPPPPPPPRKPDGSQHIVQGGGGEFRAQEVPFDFNRFLEQMRHRSATPIAKYFKSFLREFDRQPWNVNEQIKIIHDFLDFIYVKMRQCELWAYCSEEEFGNAKEGMEKLVMNRLYPHTFSPTTADDAERDDVLHHKIEIFRWVTEEHLDILPSAHNESFLQFAQSELIKINNYKAPRDKLICILNCCKVIFGLIKHVEGNAGADKFFPVLVYVVLKANPPKLVSNVQYISRFRQPSKLQSEAGYYLTNLMGAISFIETMDATSLSITQEEFDRDIEKTLLQLEKERPAQEAPRERVTYENAINPTSRNLARAFATAPGGGGPEAGPSEFGPQMNFPISIDKQLDKAQALLEKGEKFVEKTIQNVGKLFADDDSDNGDSGRDYPGRAYGAPLSTTEAPVPPGHPGLSATGEGTKARPKSPEFDPTAGAPSPGQSRRDAATRAGAVDPDSTEFREAASMLRAMFSNVEPKVVDMILQNHHGQLSPSIDVLLEIASNLPESQAPGEYTTNPDGTTKSIGDIAASRPELLTNQDNDPEKMPKESLI